MAGIDCWHQFVDQACPFQIVGLFKFLDIDDREITPEENMGDVMGDLNRRRGMVQGMDDSSSGKIINAEVPLAEMFGYATDLRSATQGRATYTMEFLKYGEVPSSVAEGIINKNKA